MAFHGELVRMENGRWARFQECRIYKHPGVPSELPLLVAVELDESLQRLLNQSEDARELYRDGAASVHLELTPDAGSPFSLSFGN